MYRLITNTFITDAVDEEQKLKETRNFMMADKSYQDWNKLILRDVKQD